MLQGKGLWVAGIGLGSAALAVLVFIVTRNYFGGNLAAVMAGGFVALIGPIIAVILLLPSLLDRK